MVNGGKVRSWMYKTVLGFCRELARMWQVSGMDFALEPILLAIYVCPDQVERALKARFHDVVTVLGPHYKELKLLIGIFPDDSGSLYARLRDRPRADISVYLTKQLFKMNKQILANLALKINAKVVEGTLYWLMRCRGASL
ncbi:protein argonaute 1D-like, partial [Lolium rigidum]|uniref:protein argonaute 1D-like n=1 Tax=Lolium rigidum TaxID=89674 RepID=UPI001F5DCCF5